MSKHMQRYIPMNGAALQHTRWLYAWRRMASTSTHARHTEPMLRLSQLPNAELNNAQKMKEILKTMGPSLFLQNVVMTMLNSQARLAELAPFLRFVASELHKSCRDKYHYSLGRPFNEDDNYNDILSVIFQLALNNNSLFTAKLVLTNIINLQLDRDTPERDNKALVSVVTRENISLLVDLYSVNRSQSGNVREIDLIFRLIASYNQLMTRLDLTDQLFILSDSQIKSLLDKAYFTLHEDRSFSLDTNFDTASTKNYYFPYGSLEIMIREIGLILSKRISSTLSFYKQDGNVEGNDTPMEIQELLARELLSKYLQFCYFLIQERCKHNDPATVYTIWKLIKPFHNKIYNSIINSENNHFVNNFYYYQTLSKIITSFSKNRRYRRLVNEIIYDLPLDSVKVCPELMSSILYHCGRTKNESLGSIVGSRYDDHSNSTNSDNDGSSALDFSKIFGQGGDLTILGTGEKFTPGQVHAFLAYNLRLGNKKRAYEIVEYLKFKLIGFTSTDFNELIRGILYSDKLQPNDQDEKKNNNKKKEKEEKEGEEGETSRWSDGNNATIKGTSNKDPSNMDLAWSMITNNHMNKEDVLNKYALITYLDFMINQMKTTNNQLDLVRVGEIYKLICSSVSRSDTKYWNHFNMSYFKYLVRKYPLSLAKTVYTNGKLHGMKKSMYFLKIADYNYARNPFETRYSDVRIGMDAELRSLVLRDIYQRSDGYLKRAYRLKSNDLAEAEKEYVETCRWVYDEFMELKATGNRDASKVIRNSTVMDIMKTISRQSRKIGFKLTADEGKSLSKDERNYRLRNGEKLAIGDITLEQEFAKSLDFSTSIWRKALTNKKGD